MNPRKDAGKEFVSEDVAQRVEVHARAVTKDYIKLMQINANFIKKVSSVLTARCVDFKDSSAELQFLALVLLKKVMMTPLNEKKAEQNLLKKAAKKIKTDWKKLGTNIKKGALEIEENTRKWSEAVKERVKFKAKESSDDQIESPTKGIGEEQVPMPMPREKPVPMPKKEIEFGDHIIKTQHIQEQDDLSKIRLREMVFCVSNEQMILDAVRSVLSYYNLDLYAEALGRSGTERNSGSFGAVPAQESQVKTRAYFSQVCLEILEHLLEFLPKNQRGEKYKEYYELVTPILLRHSARINDCGSLEVFGLTRSNPYADGL